jgi:hypothetical protein
VEEEVGGGGFWRGVGFGGGGGGFLFAEEEGWCVEGVGFEEGGREVGEGCAAVGGGTADDEVMDEFPYWGEPFGVGG